MSELVIYPIVGAKYRPNGVPVLSVLSIGTALKLAADLHNPVDPNAIGVYVNKDQLTDAAVLVLGDEHDIDIAILPELIHLGFIPAALATVLRDRGFLATDGAFSVSATGKPQIVILREKLP